MMRKVVVYAVCSTVIMGLAGIGYAAAAQRDAAKYVGMKSCKMCHKKDDTGNQYQKWLDEKHSKAYPTLASDEAKAVGKKVGVDDPQKSGKCLKCHSTAYNFTETKATEAITVEEGVTCEGCHGPGEGYKAKAVMEDQAKSIAGGLIHPATQSCVLCHNDTAPSWKADRYTTKDGAKVGFDLPQAVEKIKHPNPAAKK